MHSCLQECTAMYRARPQRLLETNGWGLRLGLFISFLNLVRRPPSLPLLHLPKYITFSSRTFHPSNLNSLYPPTIHHGAPHHSVPRLRLALLFPHHNPSLHVANALHLRADSGDRATASQRRAGGMDASFLFLFLFVASLHFFLFHRFLPFTHNAAPSSHLPPPIFPLHIPAPGLRGRGQKPIPQPQTHLQHPPPITHPLTLTRHKSTRASPTPPPSPSPTPPRTPPRNAPARPLRAWSGGSSRKWDSRPM